MILKEESNLLQELKEKLSDRNWRLNNLYYIRDASGANIKFRPNPVQQNIIDNLHNKTVILKARQFGVCLDPKTKVLTAELKWKPIKDLVVGEKIISVDENTGTRGSGRKLRTGEVEGIVFHKRDTYKITLSDGQEVICTGKHPWLTRKAGTDVKWRSIEGNGLGRKKSKIKVGTKIRWVAPLWDEPTYEDGWFGGMIDGEGHFDMRNCGGVRISIAQVDGDVLKRMISYCEKNNIRYRIEVDNRKAGGKSKLGNKPVYKIVVQRLDEVFKVVGKTRPTKIISKRFWEGKELPAVSREEGSWKTIVKIEHLGIGDVVDLQTSVGTYIADGLVSHNTTLFCILWLDEALFSFKTAAIIAHTARNAEEIFDTKVKYAWDRLPQIIKDQYTLDADNAKMLKFKRGEKESSIAVSTSLRSGTVQRLLVTELGTLDQKYPDKSNEIMTGALNTVHKGQIVVVESTSKGQYGNFYNICKKAQEFDLSGMEHSEMDWKFHFYPWFYHQDYFLNGQFVLPQEMVDYFQSLETKGIILSQSQKNWYWKKSQDQSEEMKKEFPSTPEESFQAAVEGAYYGKYIDQLREQKRICYVPYDKNLPVETWWDLGMRDSTAIIFTQRQGAEIRIIDYYENSNEGLLHYAGVLKDKGYNYSAHYAPHDIAVKELGTGKSRLEQARDLGDGLSIYFQVVPNIPLADGIECVRRILPNCFFDEQKTSTLVQYLSEYRKEWDEKLGRWKDKPLHNYTSHAADAARYLAVGMRDIGAMITRTYEEVHYKEEREVESFNKFNTLPEL